MGKKLDKAKQIGGTVLKIAEIIIAAKETYDKTKGTLGSTDKK